MINKNTETLNGPKIYEWTCEWATDRSFKLFAEDELSSTNSVAKEDKNPATRPNLDSKSFGKSQLVSPPSVYLTQCQTHGRGRGNHTWTTPPGSALLSSWSFSVASVPQPIFSALVGLALYEACRTIWPQLPFNIKAPNDLFVSDKKIAGILIETVDHGVEKRTVIGVGMNIGAKPNDLQTATCLTEHLDVNLVQSLWFDFLDTWVANLKSACREGLKEHLEPPIAARLCQALNRHPLLHEPILRVDELGQLHSLSRIVRWNEL